MNSNNDNAELDERSFCRITPYGTEIWELKDGRRHRTDGPAVDWAHGEKQWYYYGRLHRADGPAIENEDGRREWWQNGYRHRVVGPAVIWADGSTEWWLNGHLHRTDGPASIYASGKREWWLNGKEYDQLTYWLMLNERNHDL